MVFGRHGNAKALTCVDCFGTSEGLTESMENRFNKRKIRVLVADGSAFDGMQIAKILEEDDRIEVVGRAKDGDATLHMVEDLSPDMITLDVDMPKMNGTAILKHIMTSFGIVGNGSAEQDAV